MENRTGRMFKKLISTLNAQKPQQRQAELYRNLIRHEAKIGGKLFGAVQKGGNREFFCLDEHTWIWHEEWIDRQGKRQYKTTRYDIRPNGILKAQDGQQYQHVTAQEALNLYEATKLYSQRVRDELYYFA